MVQVLGVKRKRQKGARLARRRVREMLPNFVSLAVFNAAYPIAQERNAAQVEYMEACGLMLLHIMHELNEGEDE